MDPIAPIGGALAANHASGILAANYLQFQQTLTRLSSMSRFASAGDEAANQAVAARLNALDAQLGAGSINAANAASFTEVQTGAVQLLAQVEAQKGAQAIQAQDMTLNASDRANINAVVQTQNAFEQQVINNTNFNGVPVFSGQNLTVVTNGEGGNVTVPANNLAAAEASGGIAESLTSNVSTVNAAQTALSASNTAINNLANAFGGIGAAQAALGATQETNAVQRENLAAATSRLSDVDVAQESAKLGMFKVLVQAGIQNVRLANKAQGAMLNLLA